MKKSGSLKVQQDTSQEVKPSKSSNFLWSGKIQISKREAVSSKENVGDKRLSTWKEC
ncbi:hypothetical protein MtrunA17_Chr8g0367081 [Medicago truncatula]|uniref:Uncharacterized protein n=1 Tax=Medicago truncatula TaxID=3880 RepID=A0A396GPM6_MEDTR|nr:hypothetical protein MtrunA17_Chr8g0367081 [Medicago truncatula]